MGKEQNNVKLIDFGMATSYITTPLSFAEPATKEDHIKPGRSSFEGNIAFGSPDGLRNKKRSRRDDMISVIYIMVRLLTG